LGLNLKAVAENAIFGPATREHNAGMKAVHNIAAFRISPFSEVLTRRINGGKRFALDLKRRDNSSPDSEYSLWIGLAGLFWSF
jgi:hypothetical protein